VSPVVFQLREPSTARAKRENNLFQVFVVFKR